MSLLYFSDILRKAGLDPAKVKLIRHSRQDPDFSSCYHKGPQMIQEYTKVQKPNFSKGYDFWCVFISESSTTARFFACYRVNGSVPDTPELKPSGFPIEGWFHGNLRYFDLEPIPLFEDYQNRLVIDWGSAALAWHQKGTTEKPVLAIQSPSKPFVGYENVILTYDELREVVENQLEYSLWQAALSSVNAIYLITDTETGRQYVGSAYGDGGLLARWRCYVDTLHGGNKLIKEVLCSHPDRYQYFQFSILLVLSKTTARDSDEIFQLESLWKKKLLSIRFGMNNN